jgi:hypothetical protein
MVSQCSDKIMCKIVNVKNLSALCLQKVFTPFDFLHIFLCYRLNLKCIKLRFNCVTDLHTIPHNVKVELCLKIFFKTHSLQRKS